MRRGLTMVMIAVVVTGCAAAKLTPAQTRAWDAFKDCQPLAPTAVMKEVTPDGGIGFEAREGDYQIMLRCLSERHGYTFR